MSNTKTALTAFSVITTLLLGAIQYSPASAATKYTITFKANGGDGVMSKQSAASSGTKLTTNKYSLFERAFAGWALTATGAVKYKNGAIIKPTKNTTLYARWSWARTLPILSGHQVGALLWSDEFTAKSGSPVDATSWTARYCGHEDTNGGGTCHNDEPQWYTPDALRTDGTGQGNMVITTKRVSSTPTDAGPCLTSACYYTSGRFDTQGKVSFQYGYIEARMQMPVGGANWPAFWALGDSMSSVGWPLAGEIDIAEEGGNLPMRASSAVHYSTVNQATCCGNHLYEYSQLLNVANYQTSFHTYGLAWSPSKMEFYVDRQLFWTVTPSTLRSNVWSFNSPFFLILNNATGPFGGNWDGWSQSQTKIDYVRAWKLDGQGTVTKH